MGGNQNMKLIRVGITHGDINGISLELITKALGSPELLEICTPIVFSDEACFMQTAKQIEMDQPVPLEVITSAKEVLDGRVNLVKACDDSPQIEWSKQTETALKAEADSLNAAVEAYKAGIIDVLICAPGQLDNNLDSHSLSDFLQQAIGSEATTFDWVMTGKIRTLKLHTVSSTTELGAGFASESLMNDIRTINNHLRSDFGYIRPHIAIVSDNNSLENDIREMQEQGLMVFGPFESKPFIEAGNYNHYDAVLFLECEEERRQLIANLPQNETIGYVSGMPLVLTYPLCGVCYDQAGKWSAEEASFRNAIYSAIDIFRNRQSYEYATRHPLEKQWIPKGRDDFKLDLTKEE